MLTLDCDIKHLDRNIKHLNLLWTTQNYALSSERGDHMIHDAKIDDLNNLINKHFNSVIVMSAGTYMLTPAFITESNSYNSTCQLLGCGVLNNSSPSLPCSSYGINTVHNWLLNQHLYLQNPISTPI